MEHLALKTCLKLLGTRSPAGDQRALAAASLLLNDLCKKICSHSHAEIVEVFLVAEAARHPAALHVGGSDIKASLAQELFGRQRAANGFLLAMRVKEKFLPHRRARNIEHVLGLSAGLFQQLGNVFDGVKRVRAKALAALFAFEQMAKVPPEHGQRTRLDNHNVAPFAEVTFQLS